MTAFPEVRAAWASLASEVRGFAAETLIWWGYQLMPEGRQKDRLVLFLADWLRNGLSPWLVLMLRDGTTESVTRREIDSYLIGPSNANLWKRTQAPAYKGKGIPDALQVTAWARTETHAIKIANEFRTRMIAAGEW